MHVVLNIDVCWLNAAHKKFCVHTDFKKLEGTLLSEQVRKYKKLMNDGDFTNESRLHSTVNKFATYYNLKQL